VSVWTTKSLESDRNYIVLQHTLKGVNYIVNGIKFRESYAVVEKNSKTYTMLKRIPVLRGSREYPLSYLKNLPFITRLADIKMVYGQDVYRRFLEEEDKSRKTEALVLEQETELLKNLEIEKRKEDIKLKEQIEQIIEEAKASGESQEVIEQLKENLPEIKKCTAFTEKGELCGRDSLEYSPSNYCHVHLFEDKKMSQFGIEVPKFMDKKERKSLRNKIEDVLTKAKKQGKF
jgi:hypothetical protein